MRNMVSCTSVVREATIATPSSISHLSINYHGTNKYRKQLRSFHCMRITLVDTTQTTENGNLPPNWIRTINSKSRFEAALDQRRDAMNSMTLCDRLRRIALYLLRWGKFNSRPNVYVHLLMGSRLLSGMSREDRTWRRSLHPDTSRRK